MSYNEGKPVVAEWFVITLQGKIYQTVTANDSKSYLGYFNKLVDEYNYSYHSSIGKKPIRADYSALTEEIESSDGASKFRVGDRVRITRSKNIFNKGYTEK